MTDEDRHMENVIRFIAINPDLDAAKKLFSAQVVEKAIKIIQTRMRCEGCAG